MVMPTPFFFRDIFTWVREVNKFRVDIYTLRHILFPPNG